MNEGLIVEQDLQIDSEHFWTFVDKRAPDECWLWLGAKFSNGYGRYRRGGDRGAHRLAYQLYYEILVPSSIFICHRCDNPPCVNPEHLRAGSQSSNLLEAYERGRRTRYWTDANKRKLTAEQVAEIRSNPFNYRKLMAKFGISSGHIYRIRNYFRYKDLP